jgi:hypothetical protein
MMRGRVTSGGKTALLPALPPEPVPALPPALAPPDGAEPALPPVLVPDAPPVLAPDAPPVLVPDVPPVAPLSSSFELESSVHAVVRQKQSSAP